MAVKIYNVINKNIRIRENGGFTAPELIADAGVFFAEAGGYYAGGNILVDGKEYAIFVEPLEGSATFSTEYFNGTPYQISGSNSPYNGRQNTQNMLLNYDINTLPAVKYCTDLTTNGFNDWHLPSVEELDICYRYLKPTTDQNFVNDPVLGQYASRSINQYSNPYGDQYTTNDPAQTSVTEFKVGNSEAFDIGAGGDQRIYLSSSVTPIQETGFSIYVHTFHEGFPSLFTQSNADDRVCKVRAVRWVEV